MNANFMRATAVVFSLMALSSFSKEAVNTPNATDTEITRHIRQDLMKDETLSTYGRNVQILTLNGEVTLKGPVSSENEEKSISKHARSVAGVSKVIDQMELTP